MYHIYHILRYRWGRYLVAVVFVVCVLAALMVR
jgi:hypothetical protein